MKVLICNLIMLLYVASSAVWARAPRPAGVTENDSLPRLFWSHGILALVRSSEPTIPVYSWEAGNVECGGAAVSESFHLKNFGPEAVTVNAPVVPGVNGFGRTTDCPCTDLLAPGEMSACSLTVTFDPDANGVLADTLRIQSNAWNTYGGFVRIPLSGTRISTPAAPQVVIRPVGNSMCLDWTPVTLSVFGCPVTPTRYLVYYSSTVNGPYQLLATVNHNHHVHIGASGNASTMYYIVTAVTE